MTVIAAGEQPGVLAKVIREVEVAEGDVRVDLDLSQGVILRT